MTVHDESPTARTLLVLELISDRPGITADRLAERLRVSSRAARRYVGILREAGVPIESTRGPHGGYRLGRGLRLPPLMFTTPEAMGLVMAVLESHGRASDPEDPVEKALGKIVRVLPEPVAEPVAAVRQVSARGPDSTIRPDPQTTATLVRAAGEGQRVRLRYRVRPLTEPEMEVDPWAVVVRHGRWYLLGWSHTASARRALRVDKVQRVDVLPQRFTPPAELEALQTLEEHLSEGWTYRIEIEIEATSSEVGRWIPRSMGRLEDLGSGRTRLVASTDNPTWYATQLTAIAADYRIIGPPELQQAARRLGARLLGAVPVTEPGQSG